MLSKAKDDNFNSYQKPKWQPLFQGLSCFGALKKKLIYICRFSIPYDAWPFNIQTTIAKAFCEVGICHVRFAAVVFR